MAENLVISGLGSLNQFLASEVTRVEAEDKRQRANTQLASIAQTFSSMPEGSDEFDLRKAAFDMFRQSAMTDTFQETQGFIADIYGAELQNIQRERAIKKDQALLKGLESITGMDLPDEAGGANALQILDVSAKLEQLEMSKVKLDQRFNETGQTISMQYKFQDGHYVHEPKYDIMINPITDKQREASKIRIESLTRGRSSAPAQRAGVDSQGRQLVFYPDAAPGQQMRYLDGSIASADTQVMNLSAPLALSQFDFKKLNEEKGTREKQLAGQADILVNALENKGLDFDTKDDVVTAGGTNFANVQAILRLSQDPVELEKKLSKIKDIDTKAFIQNNLVQFGNQYAEYEQINTQMGAISPITQNDVKEAENIQRMNESVTNILDKATPESNKLKILIEKETGLRNVNASNWLQSLTAEQRNKVIRKLLSATKGK